LAECFFVTPDAKFLCEGMSLQSVALSGGGGTILVRDIIQPQTVRATTNPSTVFLQDEFEAWWVNAQPERGPSIRPPEPYITTDEALQFMKEAGIDTSGMQEKTPHEIIDLAKQQLLRLEDRSG
jgi:hypothetical protein